MKEAIGPERLSVQRVLPDSPGFTRKYNPDSRQALALVHHTPLTLGGLDMTHTCLIHVVHALEGHETELGALTDANRRRDLIN
jgi:hypothetical protein